ncbi:YdeI/OmpD-associated family protein [Paracoccus methylarcula]|nr:YdeI/OmpD-associated family protein [Paracoccus methylarcula]
MSESDTRIKAYFSEPKPWRAELATLRAILRDTPLTEEFKWRSPCYCFENANIVTLWRLKDCCALGFFKGVLLEDREGILIAPGENSQSMRKVEFTGLAEITGLETVLKDYIGEAIELEKAGLKVSFSKHAPEFPGELIDRLDEDPEFRTAFEALTPGRQRGYVLHFSQAKQSATRISRIAKCAPRILEGKGLHDR